MKTTRDEVMKEGEEEKLRISFVKMHHLLAQHRGTFLSLMSLIEANIDSVLSDYFCSYDSEKMNEIKYILFATNKISLSSKRQILMSIIKKNYDEFQKKYSSLESELIALFKRRNIFAHERFVFSDDRIKGFDGENLYLKNYREKSGQLFTEEIHLNGDIIKSYGSKVDEIIGWLKELNQLVKT